MARGPEVRTRGAAQGRRREARGAREAREADEAPEQVPGRGRRLDRRRRPEPRRPLRPPRPPRRPAPRLAQAKQPSHHTRSRWGRTKAVSGRSRRTWYDGGGRNLTSRAEGRAIVRTTACCPTDARSHGTRRARSTASVWTRSVRSSTALRWPSLRPSRPRPSRATPAQRIRIPRRRPWVPLLLPPRLAPRRA